MSITTNAALRDTGAKPHFVGSSDRQVARCTRCDQATHVDELRFRDEPPLFRNRVEVLLRCCACDHMHWVVVMSRDKDAALDFFVDDAK
jgi:hypothetical protein